MELIYSGIGVVLGIGVVSIYVTKLLTLLKEVAEVLTSVQSMLEDGQVTKEEVAKVVEESKDVVEAVKSFGKK